MRLKLKTSLPGRRAFDHHTKRGRSSPVLFQHGRAGTLPQFLPEVIAMFADRSDAGRHLDQARYRWKGDKPIVYGLARGGVPLAAEFAKALGAPLEVGWCARSALPASRNLR